MYIILVATLLNCPACWWTGKRRLVNLFIDRFTAHRFLRGFESPAVGGEASCRMHIVPILCAITVMNTSRKNIQRHNLGRVNLLFWNVFPSRGGKEGRASSPYFCRKRVLYCSTPLLHILRIWLSYFPLKQSLTGKKTLSDLRIAAGKAYGFRAESARNLKRFQIIIIKKKQ